MGYTMECTKSQSWRLLLQVKCQSFFFFFKLIHIDLVLIYLLLFILWFKHSTNIYWACATCQGPFQVMRIQGWIRFYLYLQKAHIRILSSMINETWTEKCTRCSRGKHKGCNSTREGGKGLHTGVRLRLRPEDEEQFSRPTNGNRLCVKVGRLHKTAGAMVSAQSTLMKSKLTELLIQEMIGVEN